MILARPNLTRFIATLAIIFAASLVTPLSAHAAPQQGSMTNEDGRYIATPVLLANKSASVSFVVPMPTGASLQKIADGRVAVKNANGKTLGAFDAPWALDQNGASVPTAFAISGAIITQTISGSASVALPVVVSPSYARAGNSIDRDAIDAFRTMMSTPPQISVMAMQPAKVQVPGRYIYNPKLEPVTLHDYCTKSPDEFSAPGGGVYFQGPCARHDLCYLEKSNSRPGCDASLLYDLRTNCEYGYGSSDPRRAACNQTAATYYAVVRVNTTWFA